MTYSSLSLVVNLLQSSNEKLNIVIHIDLNLFYLVLHLLVRVALKNNDQKHKSRLSELMITL